MDFNLSPAQLDWQSRARRLGKELAADAAAGEVIRSAAAAGLLSDTFDPLAAVVAVEALSYESSSSGVSLAL
ncbi:MAG TPA: hypothetical protein VFS23_16565, partial [Vicinamibacterales bacterium]|nr:hypothetical protein [Vicinamibacterales bacterium]